MNRGSSNRGARGAATNTRGSSFRGRGRGASRGGSSSKFAYSQDSVRSGAYISKVPKLDPAVWDEVYASQQRGAKRIPSSSYSLNGHFDKKRRSNYHTGSTPEPPTNNSFEAERIANAARREQRGQRGGGNPSISGAPDSRGAFRNKSVRFQSPPTQQNAPQQQKPNFGQQPKFGPIPGQKPFVIPKKPGSQHPKSKLSQSFTLSSSDDDEHVTKIKNTLKHNDLLNDPAWPMAQPGDPRQNSAVKDFWGKMKEHRSKVRQVLMKAGLIDDPDKPKKLSEAIDFKGTCEEMCPRFEQITRIMEHDVKNLEREMGPDGTMWPVPQKMIKAYGRSSAGQDAPLPDDIRTPGALKRTLDYLIKDILGDQNNLPTVHNFLWDRTRSIRRDFTFQQASLTSTDYADEVYCLETIARFHVVALHQMSDPSNTSVDFSEHQEIEQLGRTLLSLIHTYEDCKALGIVCPNEAEFRAYHVVYHARNPAMMEAVQDWGRDFWNNDTMQTAISLVECLHNIWEINGPLKPHSASDIGMNFCNRFFAILQQPDISYVMSCFAELHFNSVRKAALTTILSAYRKQRDQTTDWSVSALNSYLHFDSLDDVEAFVEAHGLNITDNAGINYLDFDTASAPIEPETKVKQPHSTKIVEKKRGQKSLPQCIYFNAYIQGGAQDDDDSLFVPQTAPEVPFGFRQGAPEAAPQRSFSFGKAAPQQSSSSPSNRFGEKSSAAAPTFSTSVSSNPAANANKFGAFVDSEDDMPANPAPTSQINFGTSAPAAAPFPSSQQPFSGFASGKATPPTSSDPFPANIFGNQRQSTTASLASSQAASTDSSQLPSPSNQEQSNPFSSLQASKLLSPQKSSLESPKPFSGFNFAPQPSTSSPIPAPQKEETNNVRTLNPEVWKQPEEPSKFRFQPVASSKPAGPPISSPAPPPEAQPFFPASTPDAARSGSEMQPDSTPSVFAGFKPQEPVTKFPSMFAPKANEPSPTAPTTADAAEASATQPLFGQAHSQPSRPTSFGSLGGYAVTSPAPPVTAETTIQEPMRYNWLAPDAAATTSNTSPPASKPLAPAPLAEQQSSSAPAMAPARKTAETSIPSSLARWILMEDDGILERFLQKEVEKACQAACEDRQKEIEQQMEKEDEETRRDRRKARRFRKTFLSEKYFYMWRDNARKLATLRRGRQARELRQKMAEESRIKKLQTKRDVVSDFSKSIIAGRSSKRKLQEEEEMLQATGVLNGIHNPSLAASRIVHGDMGPPRSTTPLGSPVRDRFARSASSFNQSTASLQSLVDGDHIPRTNGDSLRRSLSDSRQHRCSQSTGLVPNRSRSSSRLSMSRSTAISHRTPKLNNVETDYFRLKARGIQPMPNGIPVAKTAALDLSKFIGDEDFERPPSRSSSTPQLKRSFDSSNRSMPDQSLKRSISGLFSGPAKRARAMPIPKPDPRQWKDIEEIKAKAKRVMAENAYSREEDEYGLRRSTLGEDEREREARMEELFRRSARVKEEMAKGEEWYKSQRASMSRSMSRAESESGERRMQPPPTSAPRLQPPPATGPMSFGTPVKTPVKPPLQKPVQRQKPPPDTVEIIDLSD